MLACAGVDGHMNTSRVGRLGLTDAEEDAIVSFMQTLTDGFMSRD
jgi:cytochrome c peroxidase